MMRRSLFLDSGVETPAVAAPAPVAPAAPALTAVEAAVAAARERVAAGQGLQTVTTQPGALTAPATPSDPAQPAGVPQDGPALASGEPAAAAPTGIDWGAVDWATFDIPEAERADPTLFFLPPRSHGEAPIPVILDNATLVDDLRRLRNDGMRGAEYQDAMREIEQREMELQDTLIAVQANPVGFVLNSLSAEDATRVAMSVLVHPSVWQTMVPTLKALIGNPQQLELARAKLQNHNTTAEVAARDAVAREREARQNAGDLRRAIFALTPRNLTREQQKLWRDHARRALTEHATTNGLTAIDLRDVPSVLSTHLSAFGVAPEEAWARMRGAFMGGSTAPPTSAATVPAPTSAPAGQPTTRPMTPRQAVGAIAPAGAGAPAATLPTPPKNQTVEERIEWYKQQAGTLRRA